MTPNNLETIDKYQDQFSKNPESKIFAPLAEAYRKQGYTEQAFAIASKGVQKHPDFASGRLTLGRILIDQKKISEAILQLKSATELSPDNLLAHKLLGQSYIDSKKPELALKVFKMALYLDPLDQISKKMVKKLESLSAVDFKEDVLNTPISKLDFKMKTSKQMPLVQRTKDYELHRYISLIDAFTARNDFDKASQTLDEALSKIGTYPELRRRKDFIDRRFSSIRLNEVSKDSDSVNNKKAAKLKKLIQQIDDRKLYE